MGQMSSYDFRAFCMSACTASHMEFRFDIVNLPARNEKYKISVKSTTTTNR